MYPDQCPEITCHTKIFHPNINCNSTEDNVCVSLLSNWSRRYGLKDVINSIIFLLNEPNFDDPNHPDSSIPEGFTMDEFIKLTLQGTTVGNTEYPPNKSWCDWMSTRKLAEHSDQLALAKHPADAKRGHLQGDIKVPGSPAQSPDYFVRYAEGQFSPFGTNRRFYSRYLESAGISAYHITTEQMSLLPMNAYLLPDTFVRYYFIELYEYFRMNYYEESIGKSWVPTFPLVEDNLLNLLQRSSVECWPSRLPDNYDCLFFTHWDENDLESIDYINTNITPPLLTDPDHVSSEGPEGNASVGHESTSQYERANAEAAGLAETCDEFLTHTASTNNQVDDNDDDHHHQIIIDNDDTDIEDLISLHSELSYLDGSIFKETVEIVNCMRPCWWPLYQTHWPPSLAPGRFCLFESDNELVRVSNWCRASSAFLRNELSYLYFRCPELDSVVLVDILALLPCSPILNRITRVSPSQFLTFQAFGGWRSIEWISISRALFHPPVPKEAEHLVLPGSFILASVCCLSNWLAYASRLELYHSCLGYSRRAKASVVESVGIACLSPMSLTCGQSSLLDIWPLWLLTHSIRWLCSGILFLCTRFSSSHCGRPRLYFALSDVDEL